MRRGLVEKSESQTHIIHNIGGFWVNPADACYLKAADFLFSNHSKLSIKTRQPIAMMQID
jgi:hypothetical protein